VLVSKKEFALLRRLAAQPTRVFSKEELLRAVWGHRSSGRTRTLDSHACRLRQKLGAHGDRYIVNVRGVGYRLANDLRNEQACGELPRRRDRHRAPSAAADPRRRATMTDMAVVAKRLDVNIGDLVEIDGRTYDVVSDKSGGVTLEPAITVFSPELHERHGTRPISQEEFDAQFGDVPGDGEG